MAVPAPLSKKLRAALGPEAAEDLVTRLDTLGAQLDELRASIRADFAEFRLEILAATHGSEMRMMERLNQVTTAQGQLGQTLGAQIQALDRRIGDVKADLMKWSFAFWIGAVAAIAALAGVLR
jgi:hypothetical protein